ncbi:hypothetical protein [Roseobacter denitrificans]|nr:hypothetical protein [Roseobacter denitrificans]SFG40726.1 hypothetical protein SAMN05443635_11629 [Roseobacter denitrificans OCh 114]
MQTKVNQCSHLVHQQQTLPRMNVHNGSRPSETVAIGCPLPTLHKANPSVELSFRPDNTRTIQLVQMATQQQGWLKFWQVRSSVVTVAVEEDLFFNESAIICSYGQSCNGRVNVTTSPFLSQLRIPAADVAFFSITITRDINTRNPEDAQICIRSWKSVRPAVTPSCLYTHAVEAHLQLNADGRSDAVR